MIAAARDMQNSICGPSALCRAYYVWCAGAPSSGEKSRPPPKKKKKTASGSAEPSTRHSAASKKQSNDIGASTSKDLSAKKRLDLDPKEGGDGGDEDADAEEMLGDSLWDDNDDDDMVEDAREQERVRYGRRVQLVKSCSQLQHVVLCPHRAKVGSTVAFAGNF